MMRNLPHEDEQEGSNSNDINREPDWGQETFQSTSSPFHYGLWTVVPVQSTSSPGILLWTRCVPSVNHMTQHKQN